MIGTTQINKKIIEKLGKPKANGYVLSKSQVEKIPGYIFEAIKHWLNKGEDISIKGFFTLKRSKQKSKESNRCHKHETSVANYKKANKGKGIAAFAKSPVFKGIMSDIKKCGDCAKAKKHSMSKIKLLPRANLKASKGFWETPSTKTAKR